MNDKKKFGMVSSFNVLCGNATYSEELCLGLNRFYDVKKIAIPDVLRVAYDALCVDDICNQVSDCDMVNVQMELGLYGPTPTISARVLKRIIFSAKKLSITMHRIDQKPKNLFRTIYDNIKNLKSIKEAVFRYCVERKIFATYKNIVLSGQKKNAVFVCHTNREATRIKNISPDAKVVIHPIIWPDYKDVRPIDLREHFAKENPIIGLFGFVTEYKNYELIATACKYYLKCNVLIVGGQHPESRDYGKRNHGYLAKISEMFFHRIYKGRVFFIAAPTPHERFISLFRSVDIVCVPYYETGQSASGIASLAIQYGKKVVFSDTHLLTGLVPFLNRSPIKFDVNSPLGLVNALQLAVASSERIEFNGYSFETLLKVYCSSSDNV